MAAKSTRDTGTFSFTVEPLELKNLFQLLSALPKEVQDEVRTQANSMSKRLAGQLSQYALVSPTPQARLVEQSITTPRDRLIRVDIGGTKKVGRKYGGQLRKNGTRVKQDAAAAGTLLWGSEYGSHPGIDRAGRRYSNRFTAPANAGGYWITPAVDWYTPVVAKEYIQMVQTLIKANGLD
jgi:hypothetical protein|tara:strand:- start:1503 stop:2042 length:540 start_codon:yes stop_codon:yes gene_type:complete